MIGLIDIADRHGADACLVADAVRKRGLKHPAIDRLRRRTGLACRDVDDIGTGGLEHPGNPYRLGGRHAIFVQPVVGRDAHRHRPAFGPCRAHRGKHLQRKAHAVFQAAAVVILAQVGDRADEPRDQITMGRVQFDHVEPGPRRHFHCRHELRLHRVHIGAVHFFWHGIAGRPRQGRGRDQRPVAGGKRRIHLLPPQLGRAFAP